jgi:4-alpha-glucanotransferase
MSDQRLQALASAAGIAVDWTDADGKPQRVSPEVLRKVLDGLALPADSAEQVENSLAELENRHAQASLPPLLTLDVGQPLELGCYFPPGTAYQLVDEDQRTQDGRLDDQGRVAALDRPGYVRLRMGEQDICLAVAPPRCPQISELTGKPNARTWGLGVQLYSLRRPGDGGIGDTQALEELIHVALTRGADALAISPMHAMFSADSQRFSPYSPSSRLFYNVLHSSPGKIVGDFAVSQAIETAGLAAQLRELEALELLDWPAAAQAKLTLLRTLHQGFCQGGNPARADFDSFRANAGEALENHCRFEALHAWQLSRGAPGDWRQWDAEWRDPASPALQKFGATNAAEIEFHAFAQWLIDRGLHRCHAAARSGGMRIGLISDLAVGADGGGSQAWSRQAELLSTMTVGAPPDILNRSGQGWGISAFSPEGLRQHGFRAFIEMLRANLRHAGGMRIDHVMGLKRLWLMPEGASPQDGAYLSYPFEDLLRLLALEAYRHDAVILGEDLGTVPGGFRDELAARGILGMRVLLFEQNAHGFVPPAAWPDNALATTSTHDLPTLTGWQQGRDIDWRARLGELDEHTRQADGEARKQERQSLARALHEAGVLDDDGDPQTFVDACVEFVGQTPAPLVLLPVEDALGLAEQANLPGTVTEHPNWQRRWPVQAADLLDQPRAERRLQILAQARAKSESEARQ